MSNEEKISKQLQTVMIETWLEMAEELITRSANLLAVHALTDIAQELRNFRTHLRKTSASELKLTQTGQGRTPGPHWETEEHLAEVRKNLESVPRPNLAWLPALADAENVMLEELKNRMREKDVKLTWFDAASLVSCIHRLARKIELRDS